MESGFGREPPPDGRKQNTSNVDKGGNFAPVSSLAIPLAGDLTSRPATPIIAVSRNKWEGEGAWKRALGGRVVLPFIKVFARLSDGSTSVT